MYIGTYACTDGCSAITVMQVTQHSVCILYIFPQGAPVQSAALRLGPPRSQVGAQRSRIAAEG